MATAIGRDRGPADGLAYERLPRAGGRIAHSVAGAPRLRARVVPLALTTAIAAAPDVAAATEVRAVARTLGEGYMVQVPGPEGQLLSRRRLVQYVNLGVYELLPPKAADERRRAWEDGQLRIVTSMRLRHDFGSYVRPGDDTAARLVGSIDGRQIDVMFAYLEGENLGNRVDFKLGRQFEFSGLDWYAFDGAWARVRIPAHIALEAFGGLQVDGTAVFGLPTFELDGTQGTAADRAFSPMAGAGVSLWGLKWIDARVAYRRTFTPAALNRKIVDDDGSLGLPSGVDQEVVSASFAGNFAGGRVSPYGALRMNLGTGRLDDVTAGLQLAFTPQHLLRALYIRTLPIFDLDSIFNVFALTPFEDGRLVFEVRPRPRITLQARGQMRFFRSETTAALASAPPKTLQIGAGGGASAAYRGRRFSGRFDGFGLGGEGGTRAGGSLDTRTMVWWDRLALDARIYGVYYRDEATAARRGYSVALQLGINAQLWRGIHLAVLGEEMFTTFYSQAFRLFGALTADWSFRVRR